MGLSEWGYIWTAAMPLAVILYYFFRKKYKEQRVSSTLFWRETMKEQQASPYLKKLQQHLLFYLQMAALLLCVFALLGPFIDSEMLDGNEFIFVVDASATMLAGEPTRFERQKEHMRELASMAGGNPVTIVTSGANPEVLVRQERDAERLRQAIDELTVSYENAEMEKTLLFAETLVENESTVLHVFTDALDRSLLMNKAGFAYEIHGFEEQLANVSIRQFGLSETDGGMRAIVQVVNSSEERVSGQTVLTGGDTTKTADFELEAGEELLLPFEELPAEELWQAELQVEDDYSLDNKALAIIRQPVNSIMVDSSLHRLVSTGFESLDLEVNAVSPDQLNETDASPVVTNQTAMLEAQRPVLLVGRNDAAAHSIEGQIETSEHPLFSYASLEEVYAAEVYPPFEGFETIATVGGEPFIQLSPDGDIAVLSDIQATDWPLSPSFPLFLWSAANELAGNGDFLGFFQPNEHRAVSLASETGEWEIFKDGEFLYSYLEGQGPFIAPEEPGLYDAVGDEETKRLIVQLSNEEKDILPGSSYTMGEAAVSEDTVNFSMVPWIVLAVLLLLIAEWEVYRRGTARR